MEPLSAEALEEKWQNAPWRGRLARFIQPDMTTSTLRWLRRSLSWLERAEN